MLWSVIFFGAIEARTEALNLAAKSIKNMRIKHIVPPRALAVAKSSISYEAVSVRLDEENNNEM